MAKKKHHAKKTTHRRRSHKVSGIGGELSTLLFAAGGAIAANYIVKALPASIDSKISNAVPLAMGIALPMFVKNPMVKQISLGLGIQGTLGTLKAFNVISGVGGYELPMIGATDFLRLQTPTPVVAGVKKKMETYTY